MKQGSFVSLSCKPCFGDPQNGGDGDELMAGEKYNEFKGLNKNPDSTSVASQKDQHAIKPHAIELFSFELEKNPTLRDLKENKEDWIILEDDYISSADRNVFQNKVINGCDVLGLTIVRILFQVAYKEFTGDETTPFMEAITADARYAAPVVAFFLLLALIEIYQAYQHQQAKKLRSSPAQLAQFRQNSEDEKNKTAKQQIEDLQEQIDLVWEQDGKLQENYSNLSVQQQIEGDKCKVYLVATPKTQDIPENKDFAEQDTQEATKKDKKGIDWPSVGSTAWELLNISAVVYWLEWGLRNIVKPGGFDVGFGAAAGMNIVIPFGIVLPVIVPLAMLAPKLFNYINNHHRPGDNQPTLKKLWNGVKKLFEPTPNPLQGSKVQFLGYIASEVVNFVRYLLGFFLVAPTMLGIGVKKLVSTEKTAVANETATNTSDDAAVAEKSEKFSKQFTEDAPSILSRVILLDKYENAGVTSADLRLTKRDPFVKLIQSGSEVRSVDPEPSPKENQSFDTSKDPLAIPLLSPQSDHDKDNSAQVKTSDIEKRGPFSWFSLFALRSAIGYIYLQFTLGWWFTDLIAIFNPSVHIEKVAMIMAAAIIGLSLTYALIVTIHRKREYEEYHAPKNEKAIAEKDKRDNALASLAENEAQITAVKNQIPPQKIAEIESSAEYKKFPKINDARYYADIRINEKTKPRLGDYVTVACVISFIARVQTGIWIGRGSSIDGTAVHPSPEPWHRTLPWENQLSDLQKHLAVVFTVLAFAGLYVAAAYYNEYEDNKIEDEKQKEKQVDERLFHKQCELTFWKNQIPSSDKQNESWTSSSTQNDESNSSHGFPGTQLLSV